MSNEKFRQRYRCLFYKTLKLSNLAEMIYTVVTRNVTKLCYMHRRDLVSWALISVKLGMEI